MLSKTSFFLCSMLIGLGSLQAADLKKRQPLAAPNQTAPMTIKQLEKELDELQYKRSNQKDKWVKKNDPKILCGMACSMCCPTAAGICMDGPAVAEEAIKSACPGPWASLGFVAGAGALYAFTRWYQPDLSKIDNQIKDTADKLAELKKQKTD